MGQFEKIVVLVAFFLVTVILVVTFSSPEDSMQSLAMGPGVGNEQDSGTPEGGSQVGDPTGVGSDSTHQGGDPQLEPSTGPAAGVSRGSEVTAPAGIDERTRAELVADLFLDDTFNARALERGELPQGAALVTLEGLLPTFDASLMEYAWQRGDTWVEVARRFYGNGSMSALLRQFNEGGSYRAPGERILMPVFDLRETGNGVGVEVSAGTTGEELSLERGNLYRVLDGDSLWVISKKVYGKGSQWERIYEGNREQLSSPDDVKPGMELRIP